MMSKHPDNLKLQMHTDKYWFNDQKLILIVLTFSGAAIVLAWNLFDAYYLESKDSRLFWLRWITAGVYVANLLVALARKKDIFIKQHLVAGFYFGAFFCMFTTRFTGGSGSPYWYSLFFILIAWFVLIPYHRREMVIHSLVFVFLFLTGQYAQKEYPVIPYELARMGFLYFITLFIGFFASFIRNKMDRLNTRIKEELNRKNEELLSMNELLLDKQQFLDSILTSAPLVIWSIDLEGNFTYSQYKDASNTGSSSDDRIGKSAFDIYKGTEVENFLRRVLKDESYSEIIQVGAVFYDTRVSVLRDNQGEKKGYMGVSMDISERIRNERDLKKFRLVLDQAPGAVCIMDKDSGFEYMNPEFTKISGYTEDDLLHKSINETLYKGKVPESRKDIIEAIQSGLKWQGELFTRNKNGNWYWVNTIASPFTDEQGNPDGYIVIQQDITEKKKMETALQESEMKYRTLIEKAVDGIIITQKGMLKFVNNYFCDLIQYSQEELIDQPYLNFVHPDDHELMVNYHKRRMNGEDFQAIYRSRIIRKDGSPLSVELNSRTSDFNGEPAAFIIVRDLTERIKNEMELKIAKEKLESLNMNLETRIQESSQKLTEANTQLIRLQKENLQSQFEVLRQQVNPHFLFNSLNVLTSLIKLEPDLAEQFTEHLSKVYRYVLENKENDLVRLEVELEFLQAYIFLLNIRFMGKIEIMINIVEESREMLILPLALQLLIENAIKHNAMSRTEPLHIELKSDKNHVLNVINNLQVRESSLASTGVGLKNIELRYSLLEKPLPRFYKTETHFIAQIPLIPGEDQK